MGLGSLLKRSLGLGKSSKVKCPSFAPLGLWFTEGLGLPPASPEVMKCVDPSDLGGLAQATDWINFSTKLLLQGS